MSTAALVYPHQLFEDHPALLGADVGYVIEDPLFFSQYAFHRQKLMLHRASLKAWTQRHRARKEEPSLPLVYVEAATLEHSGQIAQRLARDGVDRAIVVDPEDDWLDQRLRAGCAQHGIALQVIPDPHFLTPTSVLDEFFSTRSRYFFTQFYIAQRHRLGLLLEEDGTPQGGQWSFDVDNRRKLPRGTTIPSAPSLPASAHADEARVYVARHFPDALGEDLPLAYPIDPTTARAWLAHFIQHRFHDFGAYEDAIASDQSQLFHSMLTPMLNMGLLSPQQVVQAAIDASPDVPLNSREGFVRQVIGWREFVRGIYRTLGRRQRTRNFLQHARPLPAAFYDGTTGIDPVDTVIRRVLRTGYCHHIERLMILGNFMLLCRIDPDAVYRWFMELFIDAYDWVMVPNIYGMSQYADGGRMTTKPYLSGSSYVLRMSDFRRGPWCEVWDGLYWTFVDDHRELFARNPRLSVMTRQLDRMGPKRDAHRAQAERFLAQLDG